MNIAWTVNFWKDVVVRLEWALEKDIAVELEPLLEMEMNIHFRLLRLRINVIQVTFEWVTIRQWFLEWRRKQLTI
jgi:hypothetical protein